MTACYKMQDSLFASPSPRNNAEQMLMDVAHPNSATYGKHWTAEEVIEYFQTSDKTVQAVRTWLVEYGIDNDTITHSDDGSRRVPQHCR